MQNMFVMLVYDRYCNTRKKSHVPRWLWLVTDVIVVMKHPITEELFTAPCHLCRCQGYAAPTLAPKRLWVAAA